MSVPPPPSHHQQQQQQQKDEDEEAILGGSILLLDSSSNKQQTTRTSTTAFEDDDLNKKLQALGVEDYTVYRRRRDQGREEEQLQQQRQYLTKRQQLDGDEDGESLPVIVLVHHREIYAGCHSLNRFINPKWETIFVLEQQIIEQFEISTLGRLADSPGVHIAALNSTTGSGEWLGRKLALLLMKHYDLLLSDNLRRSRTTTADLPKLQTQQETPLLLSAQCDIHPLPTWHKHYISFETIVTRMVDSFLEENRLNREHKITSVNDYKHILDGPWIQKDCEKPFSVKERPLLAMNTILLETLPSSDTLFKSKFHGPSTGLSQGWRRKSKTIQPRGESSKEAAPWISDVSSLVEGHLVLFNATMLAEIVNPIAAVHATVSNADAAIAQELCQRGWKAIRVNDIQLLYDLAKPQYVSSSESNGTKHHLFDPTNYGSVSKSTMNRQSMTYLAEVASPMGCFREYMRLRVFGNFDIISFCGIAYMHLQTNHLPTTFWKENIKVGDNSQILFNLMKLWGYELADTTAQNYVFVSVPTNHTAIVGPFSASLRKGFSSGDMIQVGSIPASGGFYFHYITLPRESMVQPEAFFKGQIMKPSLQRDVDVHSPTFDFMATSLNMCLWVADDSEEWEASLPLTRAQVLRSLAPLADDCEEYMKKIRSDASPQLWESVNETVVSELR